MSFIDYLSASLRLVDLIDSRHEKGGQFAAYSSEERPGNSKGYWLDIAIHLLQFLRDREAATGDGYVHLDEFKDFIQERHPGITDNDIHYVASVLSCPTVFEYIDPDEQLPVPKSTKATSLLEKSKIQSGYRLSRRGRECLALSDGYQSIIYADQDARKIGAAIDCRRFDDASRFCQEIVSRIRSFAIEITRSLERPDRESLLKDFLEHHQSYIEIMENVQHAAEESRHKLSSESVIDAFGDKYGDLAEIERIALISRIKQLLKSSALLGRKVAEMVAVVQERSKSGSTSYRFEKMAIRFALSVRGSYGMNRIMSMVAPWTSAISYLTLSDSSKFFREAANAKSAKAMTFDRRQGDMPEAISELFREHLDEIRSRLQEGPLPLSEALEKEWLYVDDGCEGLSKMVGVYNCPDAFGFGEATLHVCKTNRRFNHSFRSGKTVHGEDIQLMIVRGK